jgi:uncharacterized protein YgiM (DUF1202 family)
VSAGDNVKAGQVLGLVGNTGNAIHTPPHLHFGIYSVGGAIDPLPFIDRYRGEPKNITADTAYLDEWARAASSANVYAGASMKDSVLFEIQRGAAVQVTAATDNWYKIKLPDGREGFVKENSVTRKDLKTAKAASSLRLLDHPSQMAAAKRTIAANGSVTALGAFQNFYLVKYQNDLGWVEQNQLQ